MLQRCLCTSRWLNGQLCRQSIFQPLKGCCLKEENLGVRERQCALHSSLFYEVNAVSDMKEKPWVFHHFEELSSFRWWDCPRQEIVFTGDIFKQLRVLLSLLVQEIMNILQVHPGDWAVSSWCCSFPGALSWYGRRISACPPQKLLKLPSCSWVKPKLFGTVLGLLCGPDSQQWSSLDAIFPSHLTLLLH